MKKITTLLILISLSFPGWSQSSISYCFDGDLNGLCGPDLTIGTAGTFLEDPSCSPGEILAFPSNSALTFDNAAAGNFLDSAYTIELIFEFDDLNSGPGNSGWRKILDFNNRTQDAGLYIRYPEKTLRFSGISGLCCNGSTPIAANQLIHVVFRREANNTITVWMDGNLEFSDLDPSNRAVLDANNKLIFFTDDIPGFGESSSGSVNFIKLYDTALSDAAISDLFAIDECDLSCSAQCSSVPIPFLSKWGLLLLGLIFLILGVVTLRTYSAAMSTRSPN